MDTNSLSKFFPTTTYVEPDTEEAIGRIQFAAHGLAEVMNSVLTESPSKAEMIMQLFHLMRNVEMSLKLDGPARIKSMIVMKQ